MDIATVSGLLGHEDISTTSIYINLCPAERIAQYRNKFGKRSKSMGDGASERINL